MKKIINFVLAVLVLASMVWIEVSTPSAGDFDQQQRQESMAATQRHMASCVLAEEVNK